MFRVTARKNRRQNLATTVVVWAISYVMTPRPDLNVLLMYPSSVSPGIARRPLARTPAPTMETRPQPNATAVEKRGTLLVSVLTVEVVRAMVEGETAVMVEDSLRKLATLAVGSDTCRETACKDRNVTTAITLDTSPETAPNLKRRRATHVVQRITSLETVLRAPKQPQPKTVS
ncbi:hypothetical protein FB446DRAFT_783200 [Lentinula raphanica]|nr:hypothetical protein FB446DRAFT_783200 [Lentinula raphanica]